MIKYLIEDTRNNKWVKAPTTFEDFFIDTSRSTEDEENRKWTNDPLLAMKWDTYQEAQDHNEQFWNMIDIEVTEHEFLDSLFTNHYKDNTKEDRACPCLYLDEPCNPSCTCRNGFSSFGCQYCCTYGSLEQRREMALHLAKKLKQNNFGTFKY